MEKISQGGEMKGECEYTARDKNKNPSMNELFDALAINSRKSIDYVFSDNVDGFYSGCTHISERCGKYISGSHPVLTGYRFHINYGVCDRATALNATLLPYGVSGIQIISATLMDEWREVANC